MDIPDDGDDLLEDDVTRNEEQEEELWVQQYTPRMYTELLSDEVHRKPHFYVQFVLDSLEE